MVSWKKGRRNAAMWASPGVPMRLRADGAYSVGLKIGRRNAALVLAGFDGEVIEHRDINYPIPQPPEVMGFLQAGLEAFEQRLGPAADRIAGIGVARPYEIWEWPEVIGFPSRDLEKWKGLNLTEAIAAFSDLPVYLMNDATAACHAEHVFGRGREFSDYAYVYIGSFIGGGVVLNSSVFEGAHGNAGGFGPLPAITETGEEKQLLDVASLYLLEDALRDAGRDPDALKFHPDDWAAHEDLVGPWIKETSIHLARSALTLAAVIDFEAVMIDGAFPADVRQRLVAAVEAQVALRDRRGLIVPKIVEARIGRTARELGAATGPFFARFLLNTHGGLAAH